MYKRRRLLSSLPPLLIGMLRPGAIHAATESSAPTWVGDLTQQEPGPHRYVPPCALTYQLGWKNTLKAGTAKLVLKEAGACWRADAQASSTGLARKLWQYDCNMTSVIERRGMRPKYLEHSETDSEENCRYRVSFSGKRVITETTTTPVNGVSSTWTLECPYGPMDDLLSVILYVRSLPLAAGDKVTRVVQPWDKPYLTTFEVLGRETLRYAGEDRPCIKLSVKIRKIDRQTLALSSYKKMKTSTIWISDDALRLPVEMHADIFVGYMSARMTGIETFEPQQAKGELPKDMVVRPPKK